MLWFKNLMVYRLSRDIELRAEEMEKQLAELTFTPCGSQDMAKTGWVSPMGSHSDALTHTANGQIIICARKEEKILPSPVIKQALEAKIQKLEADQGRKLKKTEKDSLKDEVLHSLLPRAFSRFSQTMMWIDTVNGLIMVDCASAKKAEDTLALLRKTLGSLPVVPLTLENPIELTLTEWVRSGTVAQGFQLLLFIFFRNTQQILAQLIAVGIGGGGLIEGRRIEQFIQQQRMPRQLAGDHRGGGTEAN